MHDQDKEAFEYWLENSTSTQEEIEAYEAMSEKDRVMFCMKYTWKYACEYKQKEIEIIKAQAQELFESREKLWEENSRLKAMLDIY